MTPVVVAHVCRTRSAHASHPVLGVTERDRPQLLKDPDVAGEVWKADTCLSHKTLWKLIKASSYIQILFQMVRSWITFKSLLLLILQGVSKHFFIAYPTDGSRAIIFMQDLCFFMHMESFTSVLRLMMKACC